MPKFLHEYVKYRDGSTKDNGWWRIDGDKLVNSAGGWHTYHPSPDDEIVEADGWSDLDYSYLIDNTQTTGWVSPEGDFYGCKYMNHSVVANMVLKSSECLLELAGWVKIGWYNGNYYAYVRHFPTEAQQKVLDEKGVDWID